MQIKKRITQGTETDTRLKRLIIIHTVLLLLFCVFSFFGTFSIEYRGSVSPFMEADYKSSEGSSSFYTVYSEHMESTLSLKGSYYSNEKRVSFPYILFPLTLTEIVFLCLKKHSLVFFALSIGGLKLLLFIIVFFFGPFISKIFASVGNTPVLSFLPAAYLLTATGFISIVFYILELIQISQNKRGVEKET